MQVNWKKGRKDNEEEETDCMKKAKRKLEEQIKKEKGENQLEAHPDQSQCQEREEGGGRVAKGQGSCQDYSSTNRNIIKTTEQTADSLV